MTTGIKSASANKSARRPVITIQASTKAPPAESPFAWLPYYLPQEEMKAVWREWGWRVLGRQPVANEDRAAFEMVCRQLHTNWGAVYRPVALLPPLQTPEHERDDIHLLNQCLAAGWSLREQGEPVTPDILATFTGLSQVDIISYFPHILTMLDAAEAHVRRGETTSC